MISAEFDELMGICKDRKIRPEQLLEERILPLQEKISNSQGELIGAITRNYERCPHGMNLSYHVSRETLYAGVITSETKFPRKAGSFGAFLLGIDNPYSLEINSSWERDFRKSNNGGFDSGAINLWNLLYFMDKPAEIPKDSWKQGCFGGYDLIPPTEKPRLELYIGNNQTIPFLQQNLEGWRYLQLSKLLGYDLPITEDVRKKIEEEQLKIFDEMRKTESKAGLLAKEKERRIEIANSGGAIHHGTHIELTDEVAENLRYNPQIVEGRDKVLRLLRTAINRGYHENGIKVNRELDAGVVMKINLRDFFSQRKDKFGL